MQPYRVPRKLLFMNKPIPRTTQSSTRRVNRVRVYRSVTSMVTSKDIGTLLFIPRSDVDDALKWLCAKGVLQSDYFLGMKRYTRTTTL